MTWRENTWLTDGVSGINLPMVLLGLAMLVAALVVPGTKTTVVTTLIAFGAGIAAVGLVMNRFKQIEVGPGGLKLIRDANDVVPEPSLAAEADVLNEIAARVLGDPDLAREAVEKSLTRVRRHRSDIPRGQIDITTHKTLIAELHRRDRNRGSTVASSMETGNEEEAALQALPFPVRVAYVLSLEYLDYQVASILDRPEDGIRRDVETAEARLRRLPEVDGGDHA